MTEQKKTPHQKLCDTCLHHQCICRNCRGKNAHDRQTCDCIFNENDTMCSLYHPKSHYTIIKAYSGNL